MPSEIVGFKYSVPVGAMIAGLVMNTIYTWYPQWCWRQAEKLDPKTFCDSRFLMKKEASCFFFMAFIFVSVAFMVTPGIDSPNLGTFICMFFAAVTVCIGFLSLRAMVEFRGDEFVSREGGKVKVINLRDISDVKLGVGVILVDYGATTPLRVSVFHDRLTTLIAMLRYHRPPHVQQMNPTRQP